MKTLFITMMGVALLEGAIQAAPSNDRVLPVHPPAATSGIGASSQNRQNRGLIPIGGPATSTKNSAASIRGTVKPAEGTAALNGNSMNRKH